MGLETESMIRTRGMNLSRKLWNDIRNASMINTNKTDTPIILNFVSIMQTEPNYVNYRCDVELPSFDCIIHID